MLIWLGVLSVVAELQDENRDFLRTPLRCPDSWQILLSDTQQAGALLATGQASAARKLLGSAVSGVLGEGPTGSASPQSVYRALEDCAVGMGAAYRMLAMAHFGDPAVREGLPSVKTAALEIALRLQHLAAGWLIYAYNEPAKFDDAFIDDSLWPINSNELLVYVLDALLSGFLIIAPLHLHPPPF
eukprot:TRINITY_DN27377_c0_g1_i1.p1 TRINITY_DN27377_c0_g1~~TRINITY_DN27377_c0_g1_i1.p1  ORF type:complete len:186 (+),score=37.88 TRINITY_DN27377_c0_g1_i1:110-667(+)